MARPRIDNEIPTMADVDKGKLFVCPYNKHHRITALAYPVHLVKCRKQYTGKAYKKCPFNARHEFPAVEYDWHVSTCPDKNFIERELVSTGFAPNVHQLDHSQNNTFDSAEDWESEANHVGFSISGDLLQSQERSAYDVIDDFHEELERKTSNFVEPPVDMSNLSKAQKKNLKRAQKRREKRLENNVASDGDDGGDDTGDSDGFNSNRGYNGGNGGYNGGNGGYNGDNGGYNGGNGGYNGDYNGATSYNDGGYSGVASYNDGSYNGAASYNDGSYNGGYGGGAGRPADDAFVDWVSILNQYCQKHRINQPKYHEASNPHGGFGSSVVVSSERFFCDCYADTKKKAKHYAARVALLGLNIPIFEAAPCRAPHQGDGNIERARELSMQASLLSSRISRPQKIIPGLNADTSAQATTSTTTSQSSSQPSSKPSSQNVTRSMAGMTLQDEEGEWQEAPSRRRKETRSTGNNALRLAGIGRGRARK